MRLSPGKIIAVVLAVALGVGLALMPTKQEVEPQPVKEETADQKIEKAVEIITGGGAPMQGIAMLKEVIEEDPKNEKALYYLGNFSIQSGQYDKAVGRFTSLLEIDESNGEARYLLAYSQEMAGDTSSALQNYKAVLESTVEDEIKELAQKGINNLKNI